MQYWPWLHLPLIYNNSPYQHVCQGQHLDDMPKLGDDHQSINRSAYYDHATYNTACKSYQTHHYTFAFISWNITISKDTLKPSNETLEWNLKSHEISANSDVWRLTKEVLARFLGGNFEKNELDLERSGMTDSMAEVDGSFFWWQFGLDAHNIYIYV